MVERGMQKNCKTKDNFRENSWEQMNLVNKKFYELGQENKKVKKHCK